MRINGELNKRIKLNRNRLLDDIYQYPLMYEQGGEWPGDWQGRTILALCSLYDIVNDENEKKNIKEQLDNIINNLSSEVNEFGYFGEIANFKELNEQQLSGNSWFLRGLSEYYLLFKEEKILKQLTLITEKYLIKLKTSYKNYPDVTRKAGGVDGHMLGLIHKGWNLSSDIGCAFIMLDGITQVYEILNDEKLKPVIEIMIDKFLSLDYLKNNYQTHATLTATRGIYRYYKISQEKKFFNAVETIFDLYLSHGMTLNYANLNWFGRPLWTEPCAVVDSFILAKQIYKETNDVKYLELMNRIYNNALRSAQRQNGGAGCETCLINEDDELKIHLYEAYFCCTMRFAEGLKELAKSICFENDEEIIIGILNPFSKKIFTNQIELSLSIENESTIIIDVENKQNIKKMLKIYFPKNTVIESEHVLRNQLLNIPLYTGTYKIKYSLQKYQEKIKNSNVNLYGDLILTNKNSDKELTLIQDYSKLDKKEAIKLIQKLK